MSEDKDYKVIHENIVPKKKHPVRRAIGRFFLVIILAAVFGLTERIVYEVSGFYFPELLPKLGIKVSEKERVYVTTDKADTDEEKSEANNGVKSEATSEPSVTDSAASVTEPEATGKTVTVSPSAVVSEAATESSVAIEPEEEKTKKEQDADNMALFSDVYASLKNYSDELSDSIVEVESVVMGTDWFENPYETEKSTSGIVTAVTDKYAYILTDYSAVKDGTDLRAAFASGFKEKATLRNYNKNLDIALLVVKLSDAGDYDKEHIKPVTFTESHVIPVGSPVIALGAPDGNINSIMPGLVTSAGKLKYAPDRAISTFNTNLPLDKDGSGMIADLSGKIIGIFGKGTDGETREITEAADIVSTVDRLMNGEGVPYLGIVPGEFTGAEGTTGLSGGVLVDKVIEDSPAEEAGIKKGDIIYELSENRISSVNSLTAVLRKTEPGDVVKMTVYREKRNEGSEKTLEIVVGDDRGIK